MRYLAVFVGLLIFSTSLAYGGQAEELVLDRGDGDSIYPGRSFFLSLLEAEIEGAEPPERGQEALIYRCRMDGLSTNMATPDVSLFVHSEHRIHDSLAGRFNRYLRRQAVYSGLASFLENRKALGVLPDRAKPAQVYLLNTNMGLFFQHYDGTMQ